MVLLGNRKESLDKFAITKAAAWAWYERGSWFEHKSIAESDCRRLNDFTPRPSRYKLEAMKKTQNENHGQSQSCSDLLFGTKHVHNSLLDMYEIHRISKELDRSVQNHHKSVDGVDHGGQRIAYFPKDTKSKRKKHKGLWKPRGVMCGSSSDDVVEHANSIVIARHQKKDDVSMHGIFSFRRLTIHG